MFCTSCGSQIADNAKFCVHCGASVAPQSAAAPAATGEASNAFPPAAPQKERNLLWIILPIIAVILVAVVVLLCVFNSPAMKLSRALAKSTSAYTAALDGLDIPDYSKMAEQRAYNTFIDLELINVDANAVGQLPTGIGLRYEAAGSLPDRDLSVSLTPYYGTMDLLTAQIAFQDTYLYAYLPELLGKEYYAVDTTTLGKDLVASGLADSDMETLGFDLFELMEIVEAYLSDSEAAKKEVKAAVKDLVSAMAVEKASSADVDVNGRTLPCAGYLVTIPQSALADLCQALEASADSADPEALAEQLMRAMGVPKAEIAEALSGMSDPSEAFQELTDLLEEIGDVTLKVYVKSGYIHAVTWTDTVYGDPVELSVYLGGGDTYVNDLSLLFTVDGNALQLTSHGNHSGAEGTYSDHLAVEFTKYGETYIPLEWEWYYYPEKNGMLDLSVTAEDMVVGASGCLEMKKDCFSLSLGEVSLWQYNSQLLTLRLDYRITEYAPLISVEEPILLLPMTSDEQEAFTDKIEKNLMSWAMGLLMQIPAFADMLY